MTNLRDSTPHRSDRRDCPLQGQVVSASNIADGVRVSFAEGVDMNAVIAHMRSRCHMAFALLRPTLVRVRRRHQAPGRPR